MEKRSFQYPGAMRAGAEVVYQATFFDGQWGGRSDFLRRVSTPSRLGSWSYEVVETKLARSTKAGQRERKKPATFPPQVWPDMRKVICDYPFSLRRTAPASPTSPVPSRLRVPGSGTTTLVSPLESFTDPLKYPFPVLNVNCVVVP